MRRDVILPVLALGGGIAGFLLRLRQWTGGYDEAAQLFSRASLYHLPALLVLLALVMTIFLQGGETPEDFIPAYRCPATGYMVLKAAGGLLLMGAGLLELLDGMEELALWRADPLGGLASYPISLLACGGLCLLAGPCILVIARGAWRGEPSSACSLLAVVPPTAALVWMFSIHLAHSTDPVFTGYGCALAAAVLLMLSHYYAAAYFHGRHRPRRAALCALMGVALGITTLADFLAGQGGVAQAAMAAALSLSALADGFALLRSTFGPPWPRRLLEERRMPARNSQEDEDR